MEFQTPPISSLLKLKPHEAASDETKVEAAYEKIKFYAPPDIETECSPTLYKVYLSPKNENGFWTVRCGRLDFTDESNKDEEEDDKPRAKKSRTPTETASQPNSEC